METGVYQPAPPDYMALQYLNKLTNGRLLQILVDHGARGLSICPVCKIGDFLHESGGLRKKGLILCRLAIRPADLDKICYEPVGRLIAKEAMINRTKGIKK